MKKISVFFSTLIILTACSNKVRYDNLILDYDWKLDVYNLVITNIKDSENVRFWVRRTPEFSEGSPYNKACIEIWQPKEANKFFIAELNTYSMTEVNNCNGDYMNFSNQEKYKYLKFKNENCLWLFK